MSADGLVSPPSWRTVGQGRDMQTVHTRLSADLTADGEFRRGPRLPGAIFPRPHGARVAGSSRGSYNGYIFSGWPFRPPSAAGTDYTYGSSADTGAAPVGSRRNARPLHAAGRGRFLVALSFP